MKNCTKCGLGKTIEEFKTKTGNIGSRCKGCKAEYQKNWASRNPERAKKNSRNNYYRHKSARDEANKKWAIENRDKSNAIKKAYKRRHREKYLAQQREYARERYARLWTSIREKETIKERKEKRRVWRRNNKDRLNAYFLKRYHESDEVKNQYKARSLVRSAIKAEKLVKPEKCQACELDTKLEAHHVDYSKPLDVIWLCSGCHSKVHRKFFKEDLKI
jgi:hypothetical protein